MPDKVLADLRPRLDPLTRTSSPLSAPPPRKTRFGAPLVLSRVHWVEPQLVAEITLSDLDRRRTAAPHSLCRNPLRQALARGPAGSSARRLSRARLSRNSATTPRLDRSLPSAGPKSDRSFRERSLLFACLRRSGASRASSGGVCGAQPHAHQRILLQPGIRHLTCSLRWPALWLKLDVAQDVPRILQCIMNDQRRRSFRGEVAPGPVAQAIVAVLPRRPAKRRRSRSRHVKAYVAVHNGGGAPLTASRE